MWNGLSGHKASAHRTTYALCPAFHTALPLTKDVLSSQQGTATGYAQECLADTHSHAPAADGGMATHNSGTVAPCTARGPSGMWPHPVSSRRDPQWFWGHHGQQGMSVAPPMVTSRDPQGHDSPSGAHYPILTAQLVSQLQSKAEDSASCGWAPQATQISASPTTSPRGARPAPGPASEDVDSTEPSPPTGGKGDRWAPHTQEPSTVAQAERLAPPGATKSIHQLLSQHPENKPGKRHQLKPLSQAHFRKRPLSKSHKLI